jgi:pimeloyl-ACP methyl ester carboxylesterase
VVACGWIQCGSSMGSPRTPLRPADLRGVSNIGQRNPRRFIDTDRTSAIICRAVRIAASHPPFAAVAPGTFSEESLSPAPSGRRSPGQDTVRVCPAEREPLLFPRAGGSGMALAVHEKLAAHFRVIASVSGFGGTDPEVKQPGHDLRCTTSICWTPWTCRGRVLGVSIGGWMAADLAAKYPGERVTLVLVGASGLSIAKPHPRHLAMPRDQCRCSSNLSAALAPARRHGPERSSGAAPQARDPRAPGLEPALPDPRLRDSSAARDGATLSCGARRIGRRSAGKAYERLIRRAARGDSGLRPRAIRRARGRLLRRRDSVPEGLIAPRGDPA